MQVLWATLTFAITIAVVLVAVIVTGGGYRRTNVRLRQLIGDTPEPALQRPLDDGRQDMMPSITRLISGRQLTEHLAVELAASGLRIRPSEFIGIVVASSIVLVLLGALIFKSILGYLVFAIVGAAIPVVVMKSLQNRRRMAFENQISDALIMIASSLRSGFSFLRAMQMVAQEMPPPISQEFERMFKEVSLGRTVEDALRGAATRVRSYEFDLVVTAVMIQLQVGGNLADVLETIAATVRERSRIMGEMRALTAEGKLSGVILIVLPIALAVILAITNPEYMGTLVKERVGHFLIGIAFVLQIIGAYIINKMLVLDI